MKRNSDWTRRRFIVTAASAAGLAAGSRPPVLADEDWFAGSLVHLLPAASHDRVAIKCSFSAALDASPVLRVGDLQAQGVGTDTEGRFFSFDVAGLEPDVEYRLQLVDNAGGALCGEWPLRTFHAPNAEPRAVRLVAYTCAGGHPDEATGSYRSKSAAGSCAARCRSVPGRSLLSATMCTGISAPSSRTAAPSTGAGWRSSTRRLGCWTAPFRPSVPATRRR